MSHLMSSTQRMAENDPNVIKYRRVPVGNHVLYHGRSGSMRQGRTTFPAMVLQQHADDGSLDLLVDFEAEDRIWEQRVLPWSEAQPGHCWSVVEPIEPIEPSEGSGVDMQAILRELESLQGQMQRLEKQIYGEYEAPPRSVIEYLDDFAGRVKALEKLMRK